MGGGGGGGGEEVYRGIRYFSYFCSNIDEAVLTSTHNLCFEQKYEIKKKKKKKKKLIENFHFFGGKIFNIFE